MRRVGSNSDGPWSALVQRDRERELLDGALHDSELGRGRFVILYGPAGIGRSSLLGAAVLDAAARGMAVIEACGSELERNYGFGVVRQLLEAPIASLTDVERRLLLRKAGPAAESALGIARPESRPASSAFEQIQDVYRLIARLARMKPVLVAVDDLQWCDRPSLDLLCFLGHRAGRLPVTIVAAWRRGEPGVRAGRLQALAGKPGTLFLTLGPLGPDGIRAVMEKELGSRADDQAVGVVQAQTGGQPRLVGELAVALRLRNIAPNTASCRAIEAVTPESVRRDLVARLGRHPDSVRQFAEAASVLEGSTLGQVAALAAIDDDRARAAAGALVRAGILRDDAIVRYAHPLLRAAVYDTLSSLECSDLHARAAALLCDQNEGNGPVDARRLTRHLLRSEPSGDPRFAQALLDAGHHAHGRGAFAEAQCYLARALGEIGDPSAKAEVLVDLAELELETGDHGSAGAHASGARQLSPVREVRLSALLVSAQAVAAAGAWTDAVALLESESDPAGDGDPGPALAAVAAAITLRACGDAGSDDTTVDFETLAGRNGAERAILAASGSRLALTGGATATQVREICGRALSDHSDPLGAGITEMAEYFARRTGIVVDGSDLVLGHEDGPGPAGELVASALQAQLALARGDLPAAETGAHATLSLLDGLPATALRRRIRSDLLTGLVVTQLERAQPGEAEDAMARLAEARDTPAVIVGCLRVALSLERSDFAEATAAAVKLENEPIGVAPAVGSWRAWAARAHHAAGHRDRALALATAHLEHARAWGAPWLLGNALLVRGVVDPGERRLALIEQAVAVLEPTSAQLELARACIELGAALRRARRRDQARVQLVRGADLAHRCGATALSARARAELVAVGARPRRAAFSGVGSLTVSELRVAHLAARGMTNREIAQKLVVSAKTVSGQLTAVYRKLDVHDRAALAVAMGREKSANATPAAVG